MLRTWTNEDGAFIHMGDLAESLERAVQRDADRPAALGLRIAADALRQAECRTLREAVGRKPWFFGWL